MPRLPPGLLALFFTNRVGRFGLIGLAPGRWRLELPSVNAEYLVVVPEGVHSISLGEIKPLSVGEF